MEAISKPEACMERHDREKQNTKLKCIWCCYTKNVNIFHSSLIMTRKILFRYNKYVQKIKKYITEKSIIRYLEVVVRD